MLPLSIVVSVSFRRNSRCNTFDVQRKPSGMSIEEWHQVFAHLGHVPFCLTFTLWHGLLYKS